MRRALQIRKAGRKYTRLASDQVELDCCFRIGGILCWYLWDRKGGVAVRCTCPEYQASGSWISLLYARPLTRVFKHIKEVSILVDVRK